VPNAPTITYGLRGLAYFELRVFGPDRDLPLWFCSAVQYITQRRLLTELVASMHDKKGRITLPGFYDDIRKASKAERADIARAADHVQTLSQANWCAGVVGRTRLHSRRTREHSPTLEVNGFAFWLYRRRLEDCSAAWAMAKISCVSVPDQDPKIFISR